jgi:hypothetical protein
MCKKEENVSEEKEEYICPHKAAFFITVRQFLIAAILSGLCWIITKNNHYTKITFAITGMMGLPLSLAYFLLIIRRNKILELTEPENKKQ